MSDNLVRPLALMKRAPDLLRELEADLRGWKAVLTKLERDPMAHMVARRRIESVNKLLTEVREACGA